MIKQLSTKWLPRLRCFWTVSVIRLNWKILEKTCYSLFAELVAEGRPLLDRFMYFAKVELTPPTPADFQHVRQQAAEIAKQGKNMKKSGFSHMTVSDVWLNTLVTLEVISWFFMGEVLGRRHFVGYRYKKTHH